MKNKMKDNVVNTSGVVCYCGNWGKQKSVYLINRVKEEQVEREGKDVRKERTEDKGNGWEQSERKGGKEREHIGRRITHRRKLKVDQVSPGLGKKYVNISIRNINGNMSIWAKTKSKIISSHGPFLY